MFVLDVPPDVPPQYAPVVVAQSAQAQQDPSKIDRTIGVCQLVENPIREYPGVAWGGANAFGVGGAVENYLWAFEKRSIDINSVKWFILKNPVHGVFEEREGMLIYVPEPNYLGSDRATFLVETGGMKIKVEYFIEVLKGVWMDAYEDPKLCPKGHYWKISLNPDDPNAPIYTFSHPYQLTSPYAGLANVNLTFGTLAPGALVSPAPLN